MRRLVLVAVLLGLLPAAWAADAPKTGDPGTVLTEADRAFLAWWDGLGYPDVRGLPFVRVWEGRAHGRRGEGPTADVEHGFLLHDDGSRFTAFLTDLRVVRLVRSETPGQPWRRVGIEPADLADFVTAGLRRHAWRGGTYWSLPDAGHFLVHRWAVPNQGWRLAVLARACAGRGREDLARGLIEVARDAVLDGHRPPSDPAEIDALMRTGIAEEAWHLLQEAFGDPERTWADLLAEMERWKRRFSEGASESFDRDLDVLRRQIAARGVREADGTAPPAEADDLARRVRALEEVRDGSLAWARALADEEESPAPEAPIERLLDAGARAVPALIEAIEDPRYTRALRLREAVNPVFRPSVEVLRVGDLAWAILTHLVVGPLGAGDDVPPAGSAQRQETVRLARAWHADVLARGETAVLAETVERADARSATAARSLIQRDPDHAVAAIRAAAERAKDPKVRRALVERLGTIPEGLGERALRNLMETGSSGAVRAEAARALWLRGDRAGLDALIRAWPWTSATGRAAGEEGARGVALEVLAASGDADAYRALATGLRDAPVEVRLSILQALFFASPYAVGGVPVARRPWQLLAPASEGPEALSALEALLAERLEDDANLAVSAWTWRLDGILADPDVGELALWTLAKRIPSRWTFDPRASAIERHAARIRAVNAWRRAQGRPEIPMPAPPGPGAPTSSVREDLRTAIWGEEAERAAALRALEARGLAALNPLRHAIESLTDSDMARRRDLEQVADRVSFVVSDAILAEDGAVADEAFREALAATVGRRLTGDLYFGLFLHVARRTPTGAHGLHLTAVRHAPDRGVRLEARLLAEPLAVSGRRLAWGWFGTEIQRDADWLSAVSTQLDDDAVRSEATWAPRARELDEQIAATRRGQRFRAVGRLARQR